MSTSHSRSVSSDTTSSQTSGYHYILEHILSYPGTYGDVPLRSMYALNLQAMSRSMGTSSGSTSANHSPTISEFPRDESNIAMRSLMSSLVTEVSKSNRKDSCLPPSFITSFLHKVFSERLDCVDFPQALTALDYLKDMDNRRRKEQAHALRHLGVDRDSLDSPDTLDQLNSWYPTCANYIRDLPKREKRADVLYTQLYVALRRWILINEMMLGSFNKCNCHAMLNTLYPALVDSAPTPRLTVNMLMQQRDGLFRYIKTVEYQGTACLDNILKQGAKAGEETGWPAVKRTLNNYLNLVNGMIDDSQHISTIDYVSRTPEIPATEAYHSAAATKESRKIDSAIGFVTDVKHAKNASMSSDRSAATQVSQVSYTSSMSLKSEGSTLERIARELKRMRPRRLQVDEIINTKAIVMSKLPAPTESGSVTPLSAKSSKEDFRLTSTPTTPTISQFNMSSRSRFGLRKMKSLGSLSDLKHSNDSNNSLRACRNPTFDIEVVKRHREAFDQQRQNQEVPVA